MDSLMEPIFRRRTVNFDKLSAYGFEKGADGYHYLLPLADGQMELLVQIDEAGEISTQVRDKDTGEPYTLFLAKNAVGSFVGAVRSEYERILSDIAETCFEKEVFHSAAAKHVIAYIRNTYGDAPEFLWKKFPDNAVFRRKDSRKWYGALLAVPKAKLSIPGEGIAEILNLKAEPAEIEVLVDGRSYYPGYHMNKKHWFTVLLDGSVPMEELLRRIDESYRLSEKSSPNSKACAR